MNHLILLRNKMFLQVRVFIISFLFLTPSLFSQVDVEIESESIEFIFLPNYTDKFSIIDDEQDSVFYTFYFTTGFGNEEIKITNGSDVWFYGIELKEIDSIEGFTGTELRITKGGEFFVVNKTGMDEKIVARKQMLKSYVKDEDFCIYVFDKTGNYKCTPNKDEGRHIVVYREWDYLYFVAFKEPPIFNKDVKEPFDK